ncbi:metalloendoproteinase 3-MMP-like [Punica granatum]|uniref:Metalloendoproteinase 3-MMP-like n=3 Tax=Punica granatum TaxID=22663 RepID=A0A6P8BX91_PUNGR|nr:metalloendoproteinase 3-MMP-like [Punica granatum]
MEAVKLISSLSLILLPLLFSSALADRNRSPFEFINGLKGCHRGNKTKGILELKHYMEKFGYLHYNHSSLHANDEEFDDLLEEAVKTYQQNYHMKATGTLDSETVSQMKKPRCGVPDIINGTNSMRPGRKGSHHRLGSLHTVGHYSFFDGRPRWPSNKYHLTYSFSSRTPREAIDPVARAFQKWASATHFTFTQVQNYQSADLKIAFARGDHGDGSPFDGPGGTIAHAFAPTRGWLHYDGDERYSVGPAPGAFHLETVALHEIGHLLGLGHSEVSGAIMFPTINQGVSKGLHDDDIQGINALYK